MATNTPLLAGWSTAEITPDIPCWMGGYGARTEPANAIHDPLYAHALALGTQVQPFVIIVCDLINVDETMVQEVRQRIAAHHPGAIVWLGATHTHSGPDITHNDRERIIMDAGSAARDAIARMHPALARWASGAIKGIATNRDHPEQSADIALDLLCFYDTGEQAQPNALYGSFPCHPTVMGANSLAISADLPGAFRRQLKARLGNDVWIGLATGAAGDISTRHTRQGQGFDELERLGELLAHQAHDLLSTAQSLALDLPLVRETVIALEPKAPFSPATLAEYTQSVQERMSEARQAGNTAQARTLETTLQGIQAAQKLALEERGRNVAIAVALLGELALVAVPGELYNRLGAAIKEASDRCALLLGYTNGYVGYIPAHEAYDEMDYEVLMSPFAPGSGERLVEEIEKMLQ